MPFAKGLWEAFWHAAGEYVLTVFVKYEEESQRLIRSRVRKRDR
jgi:hypothetical protein